MIVFFCVVIGSMKFAPPFFNDILLKKILQASAEYATDPCCNIDLGWDICCYTQVRPVLQPAFVGQNEGVIFFQWL